MYHNIQRSIKHELHKYNMLLLYKSDGIDPKVIICSSTIVEWLQIERREESVDRVIWSVKEIKLQILQFTVRPDDPVIFTFLHEIILGENMPSDIYSGSNFKKT